MARATANVDKGNTLEDLATYLTLLIPGWIPQRNVMTKYNEFESDIIVSDRTQAANLNAELFGRHILVECKNWKDPVGVQDVGYFLYRMILTRTKFGILFASNGITGSSEKSQGRDAATSLIHRAFAHNGYICIVLSTKDLHELKNGQSFWTMIVEKAEEVRFVRVYRS